MLQTEMLDTKTVIQATADSKGFILGGPETGTTGATIAVNGNSSLALEIKGVSKKFGSVVAIKQLDLSVAQGQVVALLGPSGCGKTTALRLIAGFDTPDSGSIAIAGQRAFGGGKPLPPEKRQVGMVFQEGALFPHLTVEQNVAYGLPRSARRDERIREVLTMVGLYQLRHRMPHELSGGQQQRAALARALAPNPQLLLLDEPFSNLDPRLREQVRRDVLGIIRENRVTAIFVTHDQDEAMFLGDTIVVMNQGQVEQVASPEAIFHQPSTRFVAEFIGMVDFIPAWQEDHRLVTEVGAVEWPLNCPPNPHLEVMVRPDCLDCQPSAAGQGVIKMREFRGAFFLYQVELPSRHCVRCLLPHTDEYEVGARVTVTMRQGHTLRPFFNGCAIE